MSAVINPSAARGSAHVLRSAEVGGLRVEPEDCAVCEGSGQIPHPDDPVSYDCEDCGGTGVLP